MIFVVCTAVCLLVFCLRKQIFSYVGNMAYKMIQKSVESCAGKLTVNATDPGEDNSAQVQQTNAAGFMINVKMIGQNFDLNAKKNARFCTPTSEQDLLPTDDLA